MAQPVDTNRGKTAVLTQCPALNRLVQDYLSRGGDEGLVDRTITEIQMTSTRVRGRKA